MVDELRPEDERRLLESSSEEFLGHLSRTCDDAGVSGALEELERIRTAFVASRGGPGDANAPADATAPPRFPGFTVLGKLGQGGFGAVWRARDEKLEREVALKVLLPRPGLDPHAREEFLREARALARLRHPNVLAIHAVLEEGDRIALALELIDGPSLADIIREQGPFGAAETAGVGAALCRALAAVHGAGIVHRDVKTLNVLRERGGRIVLADFGLGVALGDGKPAAREEIVAGSPLFMAPEQVRGAKVDPRTDLYAAGVVLYHLATGRFPLPAIAISELFSRIETGKLVPIRDARADLPEGFCRVVMKALALDPAERFQSAGEMEEALLSGLGTGSGTGPERSSRIAPAPPPRRSRRGLLVLAGMASLAASFLALLFILGGAGEDFRVAEASLWRSGSGPKGELKEGDPVAVGDAVHLRFQADRDVHLYVLNEDEKGERYLLFPLRGGDLRNPLPPGERHRLPGPVKGSEASWKVTSAGGKEWIFIVASRKPIPILEGLVPGASATASPETLALGYPQVGRKEAAEVLRGMGGVEIDPVASGPDNFLLSRYIEGLEKTQGSSGESKARESKKGVWAGKFALRNP